MSWNFLFQNNLTLKLCKKNVATAYIVLISCLGICMTNAYGVQDTLWFEIIYPAELSYLFKMVPARDFGGVIHYPLKKAPLVVADPLDACSNEIKNGYDITGNIVLAKRGSCSFVTKAVNLDSYHPAMILIYNNDPEDIEEWIEMASDSTNRGNLVNAPVFYILGKDGHKIETFLSHRKNFYFALVNVPINVTSFDATVRSNYPPWDYL